MFIETNSQYGTGFEISEYKGKISLIAAKQGKDKVFQKWGEIEIGKDKTQRLPVSVEIGDSKEAAIRTLKAAIQFLLAGKIQGADDERQTGLPDDVPF